MEPTPAKTVISRFNGVKAVADALGLERTAVQRWTYPRPGSTTGATGTGGMIPQKHWQPLLDAAAKRGIDLELIDLFPSISPEKPAKRRRAS